MMIGKLIAQGRTAEIYGYDNDKVLKLYREGFPKRAIEYEYNVSVELARDNLDVPKAYEFIEFDKRSGIVYEKISGKTLMDIISAEPWKLSEHAKRLAQIHFELHKPVGNSLISVKDRLVDNISNAGLLEDNIKERLMDYICKLPDGDTICHGDFHPDNILAAHDRYFVIDWLTAARGDRLSDVARTMVLFEFGVVPEQKSSLEKQIINLLRKRMSSIYLKHYIKLSGVCRQDIEKWKLPVIAARLTEWLPQSEKDALVRYVKENIDRI